MKKKTFYIIGCSFFLLLVANGLTAQCDKSVVIQASDDYLAGRFDEVILRLSNCAFSGDYKNKTSDIQIEALTTLALSFIALDSLKDAAFTVEKLIKINPAFKPQTDAPYYFKYLIKRQKIIQEDSQVVSVSKVEENIHESPATVIRITAEEIKRRGYMDLEQLLHDLSGFDISRSNGRQYSNIYPRGFRSDNTNRFLLLLDGVEENDLWGNFVYLSRQYPISIIKNVEVIYGSSSSTYGSSAFVGVISINTKSPTEMINEEKLIGVTAETGYGSWNTRYLDFTSAVLASKDNNMRMSFTARLFQSNEENFGEESSHDYKPRTLDDSFLSMGTFSTWEDRLREAMEIKDNSNAEAFNQIYGNHPNSNYFDLNIDGNGQASILLTDTGLEQALELENSLMKSTAYSDKSTLGFFYFKARMENVRIGGRYWFKEEGTGVLFNDMQRTGTDEGHYWSPHNTSMYVKYDNQINKSVKYVHNTQFVSHGYLKNNNVTKLRGYSNRGFGLEDLLEETTPYWTTDYLTTRSNQFRVENSFIYAPSPHFYLVSGFEVRYSSIQDTYSTTNATGGYNSGDHYFYGSAGTYAQVRYQSKELIFTGGIRHDYNQLLGNIGYPNTATGYGNQFSSRLAVVYHPDKYILKTIIATAFKEATNDDKFSIVSGFRDLANPNLRPEQVVNYEVSAKRFLDKDKRSSMELVSYFSDYTSLITSSRVFSPQYGFTTQFQNTGLRRVFGIQSTVDYHHASTIGQFYFYGNYTFTAPYDRASEGGFLTDIYGDTITSGGVFVTQLRVGDIAKHQINFGSNYKPNKFWNFNLRGNFVGKRPTGNGTTVIGNQDIFDPYLVMNGAVSYIFPNKGITIQGVVNNIFNHRYYSPGINVADNFDYSSSLPQNRINFHLKVKWDFSIVDFY